MIEPLAIFVAFTKQLKTLLAEVHMIVRYIASRLFVPSNCNLSYVEKFVLTLSRV